MPEFRYLRPKPQPEGQRPLVVFLHNGTQLPAEGKRVAEDAHVRMLMRDGDVEEFSPESASEQPVKTPRRERAEESR